MIESLKNEKIKRFQRLLQKNSERKKTKTFIVEGVQENERARKFSFEPIEYFICPSIFTGKMPSQHTHLVSEQVYAKIAYRGSTEGIIGIYHEKDTLLQNFTPQDTAAVILLESVEKPGNLGAVLRSCEAFGIAAVIVTDPKVDFYNPNVIRSSVGCLFGMQFYQASNEEAYQFFSQKGFQIITTFMDNERKIMPSCNLKSKSVVCFGTEHSGLSDFWKDKGRNYLIPMSGSIDSLNLSNAVAITCYEILRQRL